jgi:hypothetical protein
MAAPYKTAKQIKEARLVIVGELYKRGYNMRQIREEVMKRENLQTYSVSTVKSDVDHLLAEWRKTRIDDVDAAIQLELEAIDAQIQELWIAWDRSKTDQKLKSKKQSGVAARGGKAVGPGGALTDAEAKIQTTAIEQTEKEEILFGDPRYQDLINKLRIERRKLLGLYAPEKKELTGKDGKELIPSLTDDELNKLIDELSR